MDRAGIPDEYDRRRPRLEQLRDEALYTLSRALSATEIKIHSVTARVKELPSLLRKVEVKTYGDIFADVHDLVGLRVVCLFIDDITRIGRVIRECFDVVFEDNKLESVDVASFGYFSVHFDVMVKSSYAGPRYDHLKGQQFEIQVRTIAMDAWANVSHHLNYKSDVDVPQELKRDFYALSGLFYVADKHFELFYQAGQRSRLQLQAVFDQTPVDALRSLPLNGDTMAIYLRGRFPARTAADASHHSELLQELFEAGVRTIGDIDELLDRAAAAFKQLEADAEFGPGNYGDVAVVRLSLYIVDAAAAERQREHHASIGMTDEDIAEWNSRFNRLRQLVRRSAG